MIKSSTTDDNNQISEGNDNEDGDKWQMSTRVTPNRTSFTVIEWHENKKKKCASSSPMAVALGCHISQISMLTIWSLLILDPHGSQTNK
jgi:hypothetical protein